MTDYQRTLIEQLLEEFLGSDDEWFSINAETQDAIRSMVSIPRTRSIGTHLVVQKPTTES